jgi:hypothetical protein
MESFVAPISTFKNSIAGACITLQSDLNILSVCRMSGRLSVQLESF